MKEVNENNLKITKDSLEKLNNIIFNMGGKSFHNHYHILYDIANSLKKENLIYLEIGTYAGASAALMASNVNVCNSYSIDIGHPIKKDIVLRNVSKFKHDKCEYDYFEGNSMDAKIVSEVKSKISHVDILFIDGDHSYNAVISDFKNYSDLVSSGGYIVFDDYLDKVHSPEVRPAVDFLCKDIDNEYEIIGSLKYDLLKETNRPDVGGSNEFILRKI